MVAQVGPAHATLERLDRQHRVPGDPRASQLAQHVPIAGNPARPQVVEEQSDRDPAAGGARQGGEERLGVHGLDHGEDRPSVVRQQHDVAARHEGQGAQLPVQVCHGVDVGRARDVGAEGGHSCRSFGDRGVDLLLLLVASTTDVRAPEQQEDPENPESGS